MSGSSSPGPAAFRNGKASMRSPAISEGECEGNKTLTHHRAPAVCRKRLMPVLESLSKDFPNHGIHRPAMRCTTESHGPQVVVASSLPAAKPEGQGSGTPPD